MKSYNRVASIVLFALLAMQSAKGQSVQKFAELGDFRLESGEIIRECRIGYRTFGELNHEKSNAVLFTTWFIGTTADLVDLIGPGKLVDSSKYFVIAVDAFGNGVSSSPSNSKLQPGPKFPQFSIRDMVNVQHELLMRELKIKHLYAVTGISMGGMQIFQWMVSYPEFMDKAIPIIGTPRQTSYDLLFWQAQLNAIEANRNCETGENRAMQVVAAILSLAFQTPSYFASHITPEGFGQFLAEVEKNLMRLNVNDVAWQIKAMMNLDVYKSFGGSKEQTAGAVRARVLVIVSQQDHIVNPAPSQELAKLLKVETVILSGDCGHDVFACDGDKLRAAVTQFLNKY